MLWKIKGASFAIAVEAIITVSSARRSPEFALPPNEPPFPPSAATILLARDEKEKKDTTNTRSVLSGENQHLPHLPEPE
ncbi:hypothetical protein SODALDRAFT_327935 [Sodiomyces alkalinus F11]|uniref:Uncharacterized protein n=1 Tax=Sodiomyces alkalinus (strain CBS 110278 / VKM F-3762 / F11) TaxID=1314773 RepID=A0A3N2QAD4_SODAK|nr:hypothetical protein SODALDRAFT_327935 [Sodiomyces alkalinus F11]ROT43723.1 hypothetical protein SODALDRAFT_327935 [Sodiomyces alkalinus F11]